MKYTNLGRTGMKVSRLCLGTANFGSDTDERESLRIMDAALDAGINFFDTANNYGFGENTGASEKIIGRWFSQGGGRREKVILATKVHEEMFDPNDGPNSKPGLSAYKIRRHLEGSLERLNIEHVEMYYMHHVDRSVTWEEIWGVMESFVNQGKIGYVASSNFAGWDIAVAQAEAKARHFLGLVCEQHKYNLNCRLPELEVIPSVKGHGLGFIPWSPLDQGLLGSNALKYLSGSNWRSRPKEWVDKHRKQLEEYKVLCEGLGEKQENIALAWLLSNPAVTCPIVGPRTLEQFMGILKAVDIVLDQEVLAKLDEIFPGPGGQAPQAYAW